MEEVGAAVEEQHDRREGRNRLRANGVELRQPLERLLERHGDERLHLLGGEPEAVGLDLDLGLRELREDVNRRVPKNPAAEDHHPDAQGDDDVTELQADRDDPAHQWPLSAPTPDSAP